VKIYEISLKLEEKNNFPELSWVQTSFPMEVEMVKKVFAFAKMYEIPFKYIEERGVIYIEPQEDGIYEDPELYQVNFSVITISDF
jgi:hypothetical protein